MAGDVAERSPPGHLAISALTERLSSLYQHQQATSMALVAYSDSEGSDSEQESVPQSQPKKQQTQQQQPSKPSIQPIVDRSNPRKIRVALPEIKPETAADGDEGGDDGPARKKARTAGGGAFSGFNSMLPAPKRNPAADKEKKNAGPARKVFSLKTGAAPGFDRGADAEMRHNQALGAGDDDDEDDNNGGVEDIPKPGSLQAEGPGAGGGDVGTTTDEKETGEPKLKGKVTMFKPLSVGRNAQKKKPLKTTTSSLPAADELKGASQPPKKQQPEEEKQKQVLAAQSAPQPAPPKPKISLFSVSKEDSTPTVAQDTPAQSTTYEPLVYNPVPDAPPAGPAAPAPVSTYTSTDTPAYSQTQTLDTIADDLNLSRAQRRHLFGRHADTSKSRVLNFNTDTEYAANQEMAHNEELAAAQHNPVRSIAPGKHTLQQLVNAASNQRDALEESFATGRRNKKEAGSKYGW